MSVVIMYRLSEKGRKASLLAGGNGKQVQKVEVDKTSPDFVNVLELAEVSSEGEAVVHTDTSYPAGYYSDQIQSKEYDFSANVSTLIADEKARREKYKTNKQQKEIEEENKRKEKVEKWKSLPVEQRILLKYSTWRLTINDELVKGTIEYEEAIALLSKRNMEINKKAIAEAEAKKAKEEAGIQSLRQWVGVFGSPLCKARSEEGFDWMSLAEQEYASEVRRNAGLDDEAEPPYEDFECEVEDRTTPNIEEIEALRMLRKKLEGEPAEVNLKWMTYTEIGESGYTCDPDTTKRAELRVIITTPTGRRIYADFLPEQIIKVNV